MAALRLQVAAAARNMSGSPSAGASTCTPTGRPSSPMPKGTDMAGWPARFDGIVHTSFRYIASGSSVLAPSANAVVGEVGASSRSNSLVGGVEVADDQRAHLCALP